MTNAKRDENNVPTMLGVLNTDGTTIIPIKIGIDAGDNVVKVDDNTTGSDLGPTRALRDENYVTTLIGVSSADGVTPVAVYADANGKLLIDSN